VLPTSLLRSSVHAFAPVISHIANLSFSQARFPAAFKTAQVLPLLKKPSLDKEQMPYCRCLIFQQRLIRQTTSLCCVASRQPTASPALH